MAKPRVTITLGGSSKVVKKTDTVVVNHGRRSNRPNGGADNFFISSSKRHRGDAVEWRSGGSRVQGSWISGNDLRSKLIRKRQAHHFRNVFEERKKRNLEKLSNDIQPLQHLRMHQGRPGPNGVENLNEITENGLTDGLHNYSLQTMDGMRGFAQLPLMMPTAPSRADLFSSNGIFNPSMETGRLPISEKAIAARPVAYAAPLSSIMQRRPYVDEEPCTVATLLNSLGLGKYAIHFRAEEVDMTALRQMRDRDLRELGIPMGPRKKLLLALMPPSRRRLSRARF